MIYIREAAVEQMKKARVFRNGRSQAVRIPLEYRFASDEVYIRQSPDGELILSERPMKPSIEQIFARLDAAGASDLAIERDPASPVEREEL